MASGKSSFFPHLGFLIWKMEMMIPTVWGPCEAPNGTNLATRAFVHQEVPRELNLT